jgi:hypothetical protein
LKKKNLNGGSEHFDDELEDFAEYAPKDLPKVAEDPKPYNG